MILIRESRDSVHRLSIARPWNKTERNWHRRSEAARPPLGRCSIRDCLPAVPRSTIRSFPLVTFLCVSTILDACSRRGSRARLVGRDCEWRKSWEIWVSRSCYPIPRWTSLQWGFIYETRCRPAKDVPTDVRIGSCAARLTRRSWMISSGCCSKERGLNEIPIGCRVIERSSFVPCDMALLNLSRTSFFWGTRIEGILIFNYTI